MSVSNAAEYVEEIGVTNEEFLEEALKSPECPANFNSMYRYFCKYQKMAIETLVEVSEIFNKNQIEYQLAYGSTLGAVRDGGQIPWDYDIDLYVPFYEREKVEAALANDLDSKYFYCSPETTKDLNYRLSIVRVLPKGYCHQALHVDIFYIIGLPDGEEERTEYCKSVSEAVLSRKFTIQKLSEYPYPVRAKITQTIKSIQYRFKYGKHAKDFNVEHFLKYDLHTATEADRINRHCGEEIMPAEWFLQSVDIETSIGTFKITKYYEEYLTKYYGDWKGYPSIQSRIAEVQKHCRQFKWYEHKVKQGKIKTVM